MESIIKFLLVFSCFEYFQSTLDYPYCILLSSPVPPIFLSQRYGLNYCKALETDYITYIDDLLTSMGAKPNLFSLLLTDPLLALAMFFGPYTPYQFRLTGPGKWSGARKAIMTQWDRAFKVTKTRIVQDSPSPFEGLLKLFAILALFVSVFLIFLK